MTSSKGDEEFFRQRGFDVRIDTLKGSTDHSMLPGANLDNEIEAQKALARGGP